MIFNLGKKNECINIRLTSLSGGNDVEIESLVFRKSSVSKIADIMKRGVQKDNQDLIADGIWIKKEEYDKLTDKRYRGAFIGFADAGNNIISALEIVLANIDICFKLSDVEIQSEYMYIAFAHITAYPMGPYSYRELDD